MLVLTQSFIPIGDASKPTRNGSFILMEFLLASLLTCESAKSIIDNIKTSTPNRDELVEVIQLNTEKGCFEDAKAD